MMRRIVVVLVVAVACLVVLVSVACVPADNEVVEVAEVIVGNLPNTSALLFVHDDVRGVGCWVFIGHKKGGVSCLPDALYQAAR